MCSDLLEEHARAIEALSGVCDLLCLCGAEDRMDPVSAANLFQLLDMVRGRMLRTNESLFEEHFAARKAAA